jgi:hypothetical protein
MLTDPRKRIGRQAHGGFGNSLDSQVPKLLKELEDSLEKDSGLIECGGNEQLARWPFTHCCQDRSCRACIGLSPPSAARKNLEFGFGEEEFALPGMRGPNRREPP